MTSPQPAQTPGDPARPETALPETALSDAAYAAALATDVGELLLELRQRMDASSASPAELKQAGDQAAHELIVSRLQVDRPDDAILSEEGKDDRMRLSAKRVWIVDPLDGTREFSEPPRDDWAVHIALVTNGQPIAAAVALPAQGSTLSTDPDNPAVLAPVSPDAPRVIVSRTRKPEPAVALATELHAGYIEMGSAGAKAMAVLQGKADIYAHSGGQYEWDSCAPVGVCTAAGLHCSRLDGSPLTYNNADVYLPDLLICRPEWAEASLEILNR